VDLSPEIAAAAGLRKEVPDPADAIIAASAVESGSHLLTKNRHLRASKSIPTIW
jgi:predicted nucleic acid-binding protein